jgi:hypothetical protein
VIVRRGLAMVIVADLTSGDDLAGHFAVDLGESDA